MLAAFGVFPSIPLLAAPESSPFPDLAWTWDFGEDDVVRCFIDNVEVSEDEFTTLLLGLFFSKSRGRDYAVQYSPDSESVRRTEGWTKRADGTKVSFVRIEAPRGLWVSAGYAEHVKAVRPRPIVGLKRVR